MVNSFAMVQRLVLTFQTHVRALIKADTFSKSYGKVLVMLLRLRQACNHLLLCTGVHGENIFGVDESDAGTPAYANRRGGVCE
jgi:hypothetical protein